MALIPIDIINHTLLALVYAGTLIMLTIGLNMVYSVLKFSNFAHAEWVTWGMFAAWWFLQILTFALPWDSTGTFIINNLFIQAMFAFVMVGLLGLLGEVLVYDRLRMIRASSRSLTVASIGIGLIVRNFLAMVFGNFPQHKPGGTSTPSLPFDLDFSFHWQITYNHPILGDQGIFITEYQILIVIVSVITVIAIDYLFRKTKFGIAMRATSDSVELAQVSGINTKRIIYYTWFLAAGITGFGAAFVRATQARFSTLDGFFMLLPIFAVVILGGVGSFRGGIIAAFIIAFTRQISLIILSEFQKPIGIGMFPLEAILEQTLGFTITFSPQYSNGIAFLALIIVLLIRPQGIYGSVEATRVRV